MNMRITGLSLAAMLLAMAMASHASAQRFRDRAEPVYLTFTPDGQWLIASYYRQAMNRPGTDWNAWTVEWNTKTWEATYLPNATMPIAARSDSKMLAMAKYDRARTRIGPHTTLALWKPGKTEPEQTIAVEPHQEAAGPQKEIETVEQTPVAAAFDPNGKHLAWLTANGGLWLAATGDSPKPQAVDQLKSTITPAGWSYPITMATLAFTDETHLALDVSYSPYESTLGPSHVSWKIDFVAAKAERTEERPTPKRKPGQPLPPPTRPWPKAATADKSLTATAKDLEIEVVDAAGKVVKTLSGQLPMK